MTPRRILPLAIGAVALAGAAPVASATKPQIKHEYTYTFELEGKQTTKWTYQHAADGSPCDAASAGSGNETIRFRGRAKGVTTFDGLESPLFTSDDGYGADLPLRGTVERAGSLTTGSAPDPEACADGVGGPAPAPDCGTKSLSVMRVEPTYRYKKPVIVIDAKQAAKADFEHCPVFGSTFPNGLLDEGDRGRVGQKLPYEHLYEYGKNILIADGVEHGGDGEVKWTTRIQWELSITRTKVKKLA